MTDRLTCLFCFKLGRSKPCSFHVTVVWFRSTSLLLPALLTSMPAQTDSFMVQADSKREARIQEAIHALTSKQIPNLAEAARVYEVPYKTLSNRYRGLHKNKYNAQASHRLLSTFQEDSLSGWMSVWADSANPISRKRLAPLIRTISGRRSLRNWMGRFIARRTELKLSRSHGLDPKRAQAFNSTSINHHFTLLNEIFEKFGFV